MKIALFLILSLLVACESKSSSSPKDLYILETDLMVSNTDMKSISTDLSIDMTMDKGMDMTIDMTTDMGMDMGMDKGMDTMIDHSVTDLGVDMGITVLDMTLTNDMASTK